MHNGYRPGVHPKDMDIYARETRKPPFKAFLDGLEDWLETEIPEDMDAFSRELDALCALMPPDTDSTDAQMTLL